MTDPTSQQPAAAGRLAALERAVDAEQAARPLNDDELRDARDQVRREVDRIRRAG